MCVLVSVCVRKRTKRGRGVHVSPVAVGSLLGSCKLALAPQPISIPVRFLRANLAQAAHFLVHFYVCAVLCCALWQRFSIFHKLAPLALYDGVKC